MGMKRAWLAALLSFVFPGLGQLYNGRWLRGIFMAIFFWVVVVLMAATYMGLIWVVQTWGLLCGWAVFLLPVLMWLWSIYDAYKISKNINEKLAGQRTVQQ